MKKRNFKCQIIYNSQGAIHLINEDWIISSDTYHSIKLKSVFFFASDFDLTQRFVMLEMDIS